MSIINQLASDNFITVNKTLVKNIGLEEAVIIGELCAEYSYWEREGKLIDDMFYCSVSKLEENTGLSDRKQRRVIKTLEEIGILTTELKGIPATRYFKLNENVLNKFLQMGRTSSCESQELDVAKRKSSNNIYNNKNNKSISKDIDTIQKPKKKSLYDKCIDMINDFSKDDILKDNLVQCLKMFLENSKENNIPFYSNTFKGKLNKLGRLSSDTNTLNKIVLQTLDNGWNNFYELKQNNRTRDVRKDVEGLSTNTIPRADINEMNRRIRNGELEQF